MSQMDYQYYTTNQPTQLVNNNSNMVQMQQPNNIGNQLMSPRPQNAIPVQPYQSAQMNRIQPQINQTNVPHNYSQSIAYGINQNYNTQPVINPRTIQDVNQQQQNIPHYIPQNPAPNQPIISSPQTPMMAVPPQAQMSQQMVPQTQAQMPQQMVPQTQAQMSQQMVPQTQTQLPQQMVPQTQPGQMSSLPPPQPTQVHNYQNQTYHSQMQVDPATIPQNNNYITGNVQFSQQQPQNQPIYGGEPHNNNTKEPQKEQKIQNNQPQMNNNFVPTNVIGHYKCSDFPNLYTSGNFRTTFSPIQRKPFTMRNDSARTNPQAAFFNDRKSCTGGLSKYAKRWELRGGKFCGCFSSRTNGLQDGCLKLKCKACPEKKR